MTAGEFRNGVTFEMDGQVQQVIEFQHVKPGKGRCFCSCQDEERHQPVRLLRPPLPDCKFEEVTSDAARCSISGRNEATCCYFMDA